MADSTNAAGRYRLGPLSLNTPQLIVAWVLALGAMVLIGQALGSRIREHEVFGTAANGQMAAIGPLAHLLDTGHQNFTPGALPTPLHIVASFRDSTGSYCRAFSAAWAVGIACNHGGQWQVESRGSGGSAGDAALSAQAKAMTKGPLLDAGGEANAMAHSWRG